MTWVWNTATGAGNLEAAWESHHFFDPIRWEEGGSGDECLLQEDRDNCT